MYIKLKRAMDSYLSAMGLILLSPLFFMLMLWIKLDSRGPVFFKQKRIGLHKRHFYILKFRTMRVDTPKDMPTHLLADPDQYITKAGHFLRKTSLDELPQIINILLGDMSIIGPRPALWNQYDLIAERDKYDANDVLPGLTGWAQINGRDELEIPVKAKLDGEYVQCLKKGGFPAFLMDCRCFFGTITSVLHQEGVVEGGTGEMKRQEEERKETACPKEESTLSQQNPDGIGLKKVLITGANSYIGTSFEAWAKKRHPGEFEIHTVDMVDGSWRGKSFGGYDVVFHVAGIAHADIGKVSEEQKAFYYQINRDLAIETAKKAKKEGVGQFVFMSSAIVYGDSAGLGEKKVIRKETKPHPSNFYGDSKWQADKGVRKLSDESFHVAVLRPPMIYGKGSKGNYPLLSKLAKKLPVFPDVDNERSMLYIDNLCEFLCLLMEKGEGGIYFPQNEKYVKTSELVREIAKVSGHRILITKALNPAVWLASKAPGKVSGMVDKAFGSLVYEKGMSQVFDGKYRVADLEESIAKTEGRNL